MSSELRSESITCPECGSTLRAQLRHRGPILCAACQATFTPTGRRENQRTSRKAIASLVLGCTSFLSLFLGAIPAVWLGVSAIRDLRRHPQTLRGMGLAITGVVTGAVFGLLCSGCLGFGMLMSYLGPHMVTRTENAGEIERIAADIGRFELPDGLEPLEAEEMRIGRMHRVLYGRPARKVHPAIVVLQFPEGTMPYQLDLQIRNAVRGAQWRGELQDVQSETISLVIDGEPITVDRVTGVDGPTGIRYREYFAHVAGPGRVISLGLATPDEPGVEHVDGRGQSRRTVSLSDEAVRTFFESFHIVP